ncbi:MAG: SDR family oxidoreductase [Acidobacteria bacterium]|nr:SDR family oxidoreductase [Acidobacteriota bacterium]
MSTVMITGTSSGLGLATALTLGRAGHRVFATMRNPGAARELGETVKKEKLPVSVHVMNVDSEASVKYAMEEIGALAGVVDVLVNNAGVECHGSVEEVPLAEFHAVMETNYFGPLRCIKAVLPGMRGRGSGCIINVSSVSGRIAASPLSGYCASKFALEALSEGLAQEVKPFGIRVAIVEPGIIDTPMARAVEEEPEQSLYPQARRFSGLFQASLSHPAQPALVGEAIRDIIESGTWKLRHPVGPDAAGFLAWRAAMSDEEWISWGALSDEEWYARVQSDFGIDARRKK